jgi:hypothetical protein
LDLPKCCLIFSWFSDLHAGKCWNILNQANASSCPKLPHAQQLPFHQVPHDVDAVLTISAAMSFRFSRSVTGMLSQRTGSDFKSGRLDFVVDNLEMDSFYSNPSVVPANSISINCSTSLAILPSTSLHFAAGSVVM